MDFLFIDFVGPEKMFAGCQHSLTRTSSRDTLLNVSIE
jgi:hypothetical protein